MDQSNYSQITPPNSANKDPTNPTTSSSTPSTPTTVTRDQRGQYRGRTYTCSFCQKGFTNAQALGGHMNIHKRDRARLLNAVESDTKEIMISCGQRQELPLFDDKPKEKKNGGAGEPAPEEPDLELRLGLDR